MPGEGEEPLPGVGLPDDAGSVVACGGEVGAVGAPGDSCYGVGMAGEGGEFLRDVELPDDAGPLAIGGGYEVT